MISVNKISKRIKDNPVLEVDEEGKVKYLNFETTKEIKNLKILNLISLDAKKGSQIYYNAETNEIDANNIEEARIIYENLKAKGYFKVKYKKDNSLEKITLKTKGSSFTLEKQKTSVEALDTTEIYFNKNDLSNLEF